MISGKRVIFNERERMLLLMGVFREEARSSKDEMDGIGMMKGRRCSWR